MIKLKYILFLLALISVVSCKNCEEWYTHVNLRGVTQEIESNRDLEGWFESDYLVNELNFWSGYVYTANAFEHCRSTKRIHTLQKEQTTLTCSNQMIIGSDTIPANTDIMKYFVREVELKGNDIYRYDLNTYPFPKFANPLNHFRMIIPLDDGTVIAGTCLLSVVNE